MLKKVSAIFSEKIIRICCGILVNISLARYLSISEYGLLSSTLAIFTSFTGFIPSYLKNVFLVEYSSSTSKIQTLRKYISQTFLVTFSACILMFTLYGFNTLLLTLSISAICHYLIYYKYTYESASEFTIIAKIDFICLIISTIIKLATIIYTGSLEYICWIISLEICVNYFSFFFLYAKNKKISLPIPLIRYASFKEVFINKEYLLIAILSIILSKIDILLAAKYYEPSDVAFYSIAIRIFEINVMILTLLSTILYPILVSKKNEFNYNEIISATYGLMLQIAVLLCISTYFLSSEAINFLFSEKYINSIEIIKSLSLTFIPIAHGTVVSLHLTIRNQKLKLILSSGFILITIISIAGIVAKNKYSINTFTNTVVACYFISMIFNLFLAKHSFKQIMKYTLHIDIFNSRLLK